MPDGEGGFNEGLLESENGGKVVVAIKHEKKTFKKEQIQQVACHSSLNCRLFLGKDCSPFFVIGLTYFHSHSFSY